MAFIKLKRIFLNKLNPLGFDSFLKTINPSSKILDIGCGNDSPKKVKTILPNCYYIGLDIEDYNQKSKSYADEYYIVNENKFNKKIASFKNLDVIISYHNFEHVNNEKII